MTKRNFHLDEMDFKSFELWQTKVADDLVKVGKTGKKLVPTTLDGINPKHLYAKETVNIPKQFLNPPGEFPFVRGFNISSESKLKMQKRLNALEKSNISEIYHEYASRGVEKFVFNFDESSSYFLGAIEKEDLLMTDKVEYPLHIEFDFGEFYYPLLAKIEAHQFKENRKLSLSVDPIGHFLEYGKSIFSIEEHKYFIEDLIETKQSLKIEKFFNFSSQVVLNSGANNIQEIAYLVSNAYYWIKKLGVKQASKYLPLVNFTLGVDSEIFTSVAKIRAFRLVWSRLLEVNNLAEFAAQTGVSTRFNENWVSVFDPWMNMLRNTAAGMASSLAGVDFYMPFAYDEKKRYFYGKTQDEYDHQWGDELAQNTIHLLNLESHLSKVVDPLGGSYVVESLTNEIAQAAWKLIIQIDQSGDFFHDYISKQKLHAMLKTTFDQGETLIRNRKTIYSGVNQFPDKSEVINFVKPIIPEVKTYQNDKRPEVYKNLVLKIRNKNFKFGDLIQIFKDQGSAGHIINIFKAHAQTVYIDPLERRSKLSAFENLRLRAIQLKDKKQLPKLQFVILGQTSNLANRLSFCRDYFELIELNASEHWIENKTWPQDISKNSLICLIALDNDYEELFKLFEENISENKDNIFMAGAPEDKYLAKIKKYRIKPIHLGQNVYDVLQSLVKTWEGKNE